MIYPENFPEDRKEERAELKVFNRLKKISDEYDVYYSRKFVSDGVGKRPEYEIDFLIAIPNKAIICLEVKGGIINYDGDSDIWTQNGHRMKKRPDSQASSAAHSLIRTYSGLIGDMPIGWALCFPDCNIKDPKNLPTSLSTYQLVDESSLYHIEKHLPQMFNYLLKQHPQKTGVRKWRYEKFKTKLLRGIGFVQVLSTKMKYDEDRFIRLTEKQLDLFRRVTNNRNVITTGPAGSGKTIVAKTIAQDFLNDGKKVLFLCFNRTLANKIRYEFDKYEKDITVSTFHSLARQIITEYDKNWWDQNSKDKSEDFWNLEVPIKMEEFIEGFDSNYDVLIIDEGQDFKEFWFELVFKLISPNGHRLIFLDELQNIFGHYSEIPEEEKFFKYSLPENCRNTKKIVTYLSETVQKEIIAYEQSPVGQDIVIKQFKNNVEQQKYILDEIKRLIREHEINPNQILILLNTSKKESCLDNVLKIAGLPLKALDNKGRFVDDTIHYTNINVFKGLEADILFVVDVNVIEPVKKTNLLYTEASRAKHFLYLTRL